MIFLLQSITNRPSLALAVCAPLARRPLPKQRARPGDSAPLAAPHWLPAQGSAHHRPISAAGPSSRSSPPPAAAAAAALPLAAGHASGPASGLVSGPASGLARGPAADSSAATGRRPRSVFSLLRKETPGQFFYLNISSVRFDANVSENEGVFCVCVCVCVFIHGRYF